MYSRDCVPTIKWIIQDIVTEPSLDDEEEEDDASLVFSFNCVGCTKLDADRKIFREYQKLTIESRFLKKLMTQVGMSSNFTQLCRFILGHKDFWTSIKS